MNYTMIVEKEENGAWGAYVLGLSVYAAADSRREAEAALKHAVVEHVKALRELGQPLPTPSSQVRVLKLRGGTAKPTVERCDLSFKAHKHV